MTDLKENQYHLDDKGEIRCPECKAITDAQTRISEEKEGKDNGPQPGSLTICIECGTISIFQSDYQLLKLDQKVLDMLKEKDPETYTMLKKAQKFILDRIAKEKRLNKN
jgi:hypothetical protein